MDESLVRELVARILGDARFQAMLASPQPAMTAMKPKALILVENEAGLLAVPELQKRWSGCCLLQLCVIGPLNAPVTTLPQLPFEQAMVENGWSRILVPVCSGRQLTQIALGMRNDKLCDVIGEALLQGIPVEIGRVDFGFTDRTPVAYRKLLEGYVVQVAAYGVSVGGATSPVVSTLMSGSCGETVVSAKPENGMDMMYEKKLMTEKDAILLPAQAVLRLPRSTVLTPAAIDVLKEQRVQVYREGVRYL